MTDYPNWFLQSAWYNFKIFLEEFTDKPNLRFLQLGAYTGDASVWLCDNIITGDNSYLHDVDTWKGSDEIDHKGMDFDDVYETYQRKMEPYFDKVLHFRKTTMNYLIHPRVTNFEFIYVDADHTTVGVLLDGELSWPHLESGGIMAFDDYTWGHESGDPRLAPQVGIDLFLHRHQGEYELLAKNTQVWIRKQ